MRQTLAVVFIALGFLAPVSGFADGPISASVTNAVLSRMSKMASDGVTAPFKQALCAEPGKLSLRPDSFMISGGMDFAKLLPATRATGLSVSLGGAFVLSYKKGEEHLNVRPYVLPSAGWSLPGTTKGKSLPVDAGIGMAFNCAANPNPSDYFLGVGAGGPAGLGFFFGMNSTNFFTKAFLAKDPSNKPRPYTKIMSTARESEAALRSSLAEVYRQTHSVSGYLADRLFSTLAPKWHEDDPKAGRPMAHWLAETAKAAQLSAKSPSSPENLARRVEAFLGKLKNASDNPIEQGQLQVEVLSLYQDLGDASHALATSTFPLMISKERRELLARATNTAPRDFWFKRPSSNYVSYCRTKDHFITVKAASSVRYFDCLSGATLTPSRFRASKLWIGANRALVEGADRYRAALGDLTHILNNTYAQFLGGRPVRPEALSVGGVYTGNVFTGCFGVGVSAVSLAKSGAAILRQVSTLARGALGGTPASPAGLVSALGTQSAGLGLPSWNPSAGLTLPYPITSPIAIPLAALPQSWRTLFAGSCSDTQVAGDPHVTVGGVTH